MLHDAPGNPQILEEGERRGVKAPRHAFGAQPDCLAPALLLAPRMEDICDIEKNDYASASRPWSRDTAHGHASALTRHGLTAHG